MKRFNMKYIAAAAAAMIVMLTAAGCASLANDGDDAAGAVTGTRVNAVTEGISADDLEVGYEESDSVKISFSGTNADIQGSGAEFADGVVNITAAGTYVLSGTSANGRVAVNAGSDSKVKLVLDGLDLTCTDYAPITVTEADKVYIILESGTQNVLTDGSSYSTADEDGTDGAVYSKCDLTVNGEGSLTVNANYKHGIVSKDDLVITGGSIKVTSASSALVGKDSVKISSGSFELSAGTDAIKSTNTEKEDKGYINISGGDLTIVSGGDGIYAATDLVISGGDLDITTGGGSANASMKADGMPNGDWQNDMQPGGGFGGGRGGFRQDFNGEFDGTVPDDMPDNMTPPDGFGDFGGFDGNMQGDFAPPDGFTPTAYTQGFDVTQTASTSSSASTSAKALKAKGNIVIEGGNIDIDSADDSLHCDGDAEIRGGVINISSGDDGIHVDSNLVISDGTVNISKSYEGIEGMTVTISGGDITVVARDDGVNCAGGSDTGSDMRMGRDMFAAQEGVFLSISGGNVNVNAAGDGLDSNGDLFISGGTIYVSGPENSGNGSVDHNATASITGGTIIASGAVGMEEMFDAEGTTQYAVLHDFASSFAADTEFTVTDSSGSVVLSFTNPKTWQGVIFSSPQLKEGETYTLTAGGESDEVTISSVITSNGTGGFGGRR